MNLHKFYKNLEYYTVIWTFAEFFQYWHLIFNTTQGYHNFVLPFENCVRYIEQWWNDFTYFCSGCGPISSIVRKFTRIKLGKSFMSKCRHFLQVISLFLLTSKIIILQTNQQMSMYILISLFDRPYY